ncbi:radical SAM/SPASM domain-containing protein [Dethiosulfatarculus sandiegensis]|uniref:Radical SAM protein n=1 Tax=Dethiosulfatarculus sandiegensis TaxID=1429043 RepID=A0A0D2J5R7_9BACT|nr:radical SAM/SPASM domain-containing protein [Dethiosulfatarculus sandiegensis]KIX11021.1 hypothetical protein X474_27240 [Dethiosulfatarculus sandiegensis]
MTLLAKRLLIQYRDFMLRRLSPEAPPFRLWVDISSRCNLKCKACPQRMLSKNQRRDMDPAILDSLVGQIPQLAPVEVNLFHRGEPLMHEELGQWIRRFRQAGALVRLHTNASLITRQKALELVTARPEIITCSVDSLNPEAYAVARPGADLTETLAGVEHLLAARKATGEKQPKISLLLMGEHPWGDPEQARLDRLRQKGLDRAIKRNPHNWGGSVGKVQKDKAVSTCTFPWYGLAVLSDGCVTACPQDFFGQITLGWADEKSLLEIWRDRPIRSLRKAHAGKQPENYVICSECDRIRRSTFLGAPTEHLKNFLAESILTKLGTH